MAGTNILQNITRKGTVATFHTAIEQYKAVYRDVCTEVPSTAGQETHVWLGSTPQPKIDQPDVNFDGLLDFSYNVVNQEATMHVLIKEATMEDDQHALITKKMRNAAFAFESFKDKQVATLLEAGATGLAFDGVAFFANTRVIGKSANVDNIQGHNLGSTGDVDNPGAAGFLNGMQIATRFAYSYQDDQGNSGYNMQAMGKLIALIPPKYEKSAVDGAGGIIINNTSSVWGKNLYEPRVLSQLTDGTDVLYVCLVGDALGRPLIYQQRTPPQLDLLEDKGTVVLQGGIVARIRQRYRIAYGDPLRCVQVTFTAT